MSIIITDKKTIENIQQEFQEKFSNLKIEFYTREHDTQEGSLDKYAISHIKTIGDVRKMHEVGEISIDGHLKVSTLEKMFHDQFGLNVQVFRKSGDTWIQTTRTDEWTLAEQNQIGHN